MTIPSISHQQIAALAACLFPVFSLPAQEVPDGKPDSLMERSGYAYGIVVGRGLRNGGIEIDPARFGKALADVFGDEEIESDEEGREAAITEAINLAISRQSDESVVMSPELRKKAGYAYGVLVGQDLKESAIEVDPAQFQKALADIYGEKRPLLSEAEINDTFSEAVDAARGKWLANNAKREGVKVTESGLQYEILKAGEGKSPKAPDTVRVHYTGTLTDGTKFDSSRDGGEPFEFSLSGGVIKGWLEGVALMKPGARYRFYIPHDLAYGPEGSSGAIPPYATLIFDIELLGINP